MEVALPWSEFAAQAPALAEYGVRRLTAAPAFLATVDAAAVPRVHPVTPVVGGGRLFVFMEPRSPKGADIVHRGVYALHAHVADAQGTGGEFFIRGRGARIEHPPTRALAASAATYTPADRYVLFELLLAEARCNSYGDVAAPEPQVWRASAPAS